MFVQNQISSKSFMRLLSMPRLTIASSFSATTSPDNRWEDSSGVRRLLTVLIDEIKLIWTRAASFQRYGENIRCASCRNR